MKSTIFATLLAILGAGIAQAQVLPEAPQELAPQSTSAVPLLQPPPVPDRSLFPVLKEEFVLPPRGTGVPKPPLAWRVPSKKSLASTPAFSMPTLAPLPAPRFFQPARIAAKRIYLSNGDDIFFSLLSACPRKGLSVLFMDSVGGRLVAETNSYESRATISFSVRSIPGNRSTVEAIIEKGELTQSLSTLLDDLLLSTGAGIAKGGSF